MTRLLLVLAGMMAVWGCNSPVKVEVGKAKSIVDTLTYVRDSGVCFAVVSSQTYGAYEVNAITAVPCTPEVLARITAQESK